MLYTYVHCLVIRTDLQRFIYEPFKQKSKPIKKESDDKI